MDAQKTILSLIKEIEQHNIDYYVHDNPKISDSEYDVLLRELEKLEKLYPNLISEYSPTKRVGSKPTSKFESINHSIPMLSLANAMDHQELIDFDLRVKKILNTNQDIEYGLHPGMKYYWQYLMYSDNDQLYGQSDDYSIMSFSIMSCVFGTI